MNDETKKSLIKIGISPELLKMSLEEYTEYSKEIAAEQEAERRKNDPAFVTRWERSDGMQESPTGEMVLYEDFIRFVTMLQKKADEAYRDGLNTDRSYHSWRD